MSGEDRAHGDAVVAAHPDVADLVALVSLEYRGIERIDWAAAEAELGTRLPADYRSLLDTYGVGDIGNMVVLPPVPIDVRGPSIGTEIDLFRTLWDEDCGVPGVAARAEDVLPWGTGCNANLLGWLTTGPDPDAWPVVVWRRHMSSTETHWALFDCGMVRFLTRLMRAEFDACPLGDASLWGRPMPFISRREQRRRLVAGLDPMTGEPDPYAEMFPIYE
jgi:hypothetical protein